MTDRLHVHSEKGKGLISTRIITDSETQVEYLVVSSPSGTSITPLFNADGTPKTKQN